MIKIYIKNEELESLAGCLVHQIYTTRKLLPIKKIKNTVGETATYLIENVICELESVLAKLLPSLHEGFREKCLAGIMKYEVMDSKTPLNFLIEKVSQ